MVLLFIITASFGLVAMYALTVYLNQTSHEKRQREREEKSRTVDALIEAAMSGTDMEDNAEGYGYSCTR